MIHPGNAVQSAGKHNREVQLLISGSQVVKQVEYLVHDPVWTSAGTVNLVNHDDRAQARGKCLLGNKPGLGHGAVNGINHQQHAIDHAHDSLNLTAEISVARGVHNIDIVVVPFQGRVLGQNGNAPFFFLIVGIHDPLAIELLPIQGAGLAQELVYEGSLTMVNVGDDGDITKFFNHKNIPAACTQ